MNRGSGTTCLLAVLSGCACSQPSGQAESSAAPLVAEPRPAVSRSPSVPVPAPPSSLCEGRGTSIYVRASRHRLYLCEDGRETAVYVVSLGSGGVRKTADGDRKTPLGQYPLGATRRSAKYGTFIGIGYPTEPQRTVGYTGKDVGIHGPPRSEARLRQSSSAESASRIRVIEDWTDGCIATQTDAEIEEIASWVRRTRPQNVELEE